MKLVLLTAVAVAALSLTALAGASHRLTRHDVNVIRFFQHHPKLAATPAGGRALSRLLPHVADAARALQAIPTGWLDSTRYVDRYFPGIGAWERSCSSTEGGWGGFHWFRNLSYPVYGYSNTPGGNLQFMGGTFDGIIDRAITDARARGMPVPTSARSFYSPLGQAIAGAQMILDGRRGEWTGSGC